jgi:hypothetical protein
MTTILEDLETRRRLWNAAVLQRCLRQRARIGMHPKPEELAQIACEFRGELQGKGQQAALLQTAWVDLMRMGLLVFDALGPGGLRWRLADAPRRAGWGGSPRMAEARA